MAAIVAIVAVSVVAIAITLVARELLRRRDRELERVLHSFERERTQLLDRIMYMARQPWGEPPVYAEPDWSVPQEEFSYPEVELLE